jgi:hypothetical protein
MGLGEDRRQESLTLAIAKLRPHPRLTLNIWDSQSIKKVLFKTVQPRLAIKENVTVQRQSAAHICGTAPFIREVTAQICT